MKILKHWRSSGFSQLSLRYLIHAQTRLFADLEHFSKTYTNEAAAAAQTTRESDT